MDALTQLFLDTLKPGDVVFANFRHGQKDATAPNGDALTPYGRQQIAAAVRQLKEKFLDPAGIRVDTRLTSGLKRTEEASWVAAEVLENADVALEVEDALNPFPFIEQLYPGKPKALLAELDEVRQSGDTVGNAFEKSIYALEGKDILRTGLLIRASTMLDARKYCAVGFSHSPWVEFSGPPETTPIGLVEAACVVTIVRGEELFLSFVIPPPLEGKRN